MSNLDIPTSLSYFRKSPAKQYSLEYHSPTKIAASQREQQSQPYYSKSPLNAESRSINSFYELKNSMEQRYQGDLDKWRSKAQESDLRKEILEKENLRLIEELNFWKTKNYTAEREKDLEIELRDQLSKSQIQTAQRTVETHRDLLQVEIESLRNQLHDKMREVDEWKSLYFDQELRTSGIKATTEMQLRNYDAQLNLILKDIQTKIDESDDLHRKNATLTTVPSKLASVKKEIKDIRSLLDIKYDESEKLKQDMTKSQIENYQIRKNELKLKEQEQNLLGQIEQIQKRIEQTNQLKELEEQEADRQHHEQLETVKRNHNRVKEDLEKKKLSYSQLISEKEKNVEELRQNLEEIKNRIGNTRERESSCKKEADNWRVRTKSIDLLREEEVKRIHEQRQRDIEALQKNHSQDREALESRINNLRSDLNQKEERIRESSNKLNRSRLAKNNLEVEKRILESEVERKRLIAEENERKRLLELEIRDSTHQKMIESLKSSHSYDKQKLEEQEKTLNYVLDAKQREALEAKERATQYLVSAAEAERKVREKSVEADVWRNQYHRTEREKSIEVEVARDLRRSQIELLKRSHDHEMLAQERHNSALRSVLDSKQNEVRNLYDSHGNLVSELINTSQDARRANIEAQVWRTRAEIEERERNAALISRDIVQSHEIDSLRRSQLAESQYLRQEINTLANVIDHKAREAADWRENYNRLYSSSYKR